MTPQCANALVFAASVSLVMAGKAGNLRGMQAQVEVDPYSYDLSDHASSLFELSQNVEPASTQQDQSRSCRVKDFTPLGWVPGEYMRMKHRFLEAHQLVVNRSLTFLDPDALELHKSLIIDIEEKGVPGSFIETGVAKGGSALILTAMKNRERCIDLYDTFEGIPKPSAEDGADVWDRYNAIQAGQAGDNYYGYMEDLEGFVEQQFVDAGLAPADYGVALHKGLFQDTFHPTGPIAYAHLDGDWYDSTLTVLERAAPLLSLNGIMILDDANSWSGARQAVEHFLRTNKTMDLETLPLRSSLDALIDGKLFQVVQDKRLYIKRVE